MAWTRIAHVCIFLFPPSLPTHAQTDNTDINSHTQTLIHTCMFIRISHNTGRLWLSNLLNLGGYHWILPGSWSAGQGSSMLHVELLPSLPTTASVPVLALATLCVCVCVCINLWVDQATQITFQWAFLILVYIYTAFFTFLQHGFMRLVLSLTTNRRSGI